MCDDTLAKFGANLRKIRTAKGLSQEDLACISGLHRTYIGSIERGKRNVSLVNIQRLAKSLDVPPSSLIID